MLGQPRPQQHNENLTLNRSSQLHQVTAATPAKGRRQRPIADYACRVGVSMLRLTVPQIFQFGAGKAELSIDCASMARRCCTWRAQLPVCSGSASMAIEPVSKSA